MTHNWRVIGAIMVFTLIFTSCTKVKTTTNANPNAQQHNQDVNNVKNENDNVNTDVNNAMANVNGFHKTGSTESWSVCGATIDSSHQTDPQPYIVMNFDGTTPCGSPSRTRSGSIKIQLISGVHWADQGAVLLLTYNNYKVTFPAQNNQSLEFNGTKYLTDVSGINWLTWLTTGSVSSTVRDRSYNATVTFDNSVTSSWNCARLTTWSISNYSTITATVNADTTINGLTNVDSWGQTRYGTKFTTQMIQPWVSGTSCGWWAPTQGNYTSTTDSFTVSALLGVNNAGNQVSSGCAYGLKLSWTFVNHPSYDGSTIVQYW